MNRYHLTQQAEQDLNDHYDYIARSSRANATRLVQRLQHTCQTLAQFSGMGTPRDDLRIGMNVFSMGNYLIFYETTDDGVRILRFLHGSRNITPAQFRFP